MQDNDREVTLNTRPRVHITEAAIAAIEQHKEAQALDGDVQALYLLTARSAVAFIITHGDHKFFSRPKQMFAPFHTEGLDPKQQLWLVFSIFNKRVWVGTEETMPLGDDYHIERVIREAIEIERTI